MTSSRLSSASHSVVVYHRLDLLHPTSLRIPTRRYVAVFTCANDYSDLKGELLVFQLLGAQLVLRPQRSPFKAGAPTLTLTLTLALSLNPDPKR